MRWRSGSGRAKPTYRITAARRSLTEDVRARQRQYTISMLVRTAAVIAAVLLWDVSTPLAGAALVLGTVTPYLAVIIANGGREGAPPPVPVAPADVAGERALPGPVVEGHAASPTGACDTSGRAGGTA